MSERPETPLEQRTIELHTSNSWRRFVFRTEPHGQSLGSACEPYAQAHDGHPDLYFPGGFEGPVARRFLAVWNACRWISTAHLEAIQNAPKSLAEIFHAWLNGADERERIATALLKINDRCTSIVRTGSKDIDDWRRDVMDLKEEVCKVLATLPKVRS